MEQGAVELRWEVLPGSCMHREWLPCPKRLEKTGQHAAQAARMGDPHLPSPHLSSRLLIRSVQGTLLILLKPRLRQWRQMVPMHLLGMCATLHAMSC